MPSTRDIARARKRFAAPNMLPDRATIQRPGVVADGGGGQTTTYPVLATLVPCRLAPVGAGEDSERASRGDRIADESTAVVTFAAGQDITEADRIVIAGQTFDVQLVRRRGNFEITRRVEVKELSG